MSILSGYQKYKDYIKTTSGYKLISRWSNANTQEFDDGKTAQNKLGAISGISSSKTANSENVAASTKLTNELYSDLANGQIQFDIQGGKGFYKAVGADTWLPFSNIKIPLYKDGNEYTALTDGWVAGDFHGGNWGEQGAKAKIIKNPTNMQMTIPTVERQGQIYTATLIDVTDYQLLRIKITDNTYGSYIDFGLFSESGLKYTWLKNISITEANNSYAIDITKIKGAYYIGIAGIRFSNNNPVITINDVWLEKE